MGKNQEELFFKLSMLEQQMQQLQQQLQAVDQAIMELTQLNSGLDDLVGSKGKEMLAPIGKGIFTKTKLDSEELIVDIGEKTFVKKSISETKDLIGKQLGKLEEIKKELGKNLEEINSELASTIPNIDG